MKAAALLRYLQSGLPLIATARLLREAGFILP